MVMLRSAMSQPPATRSRYRPALAGSTTGLPNFTEYRTESGSWPSMLARTAAALNIPCAIAVGKPNSLAPTELV